jgi:hypothetical protein
MVANVAHVPFLPMGKKNAETAATDQINFRLKRATIERMERFSELHPLHPKLTQIVEAALKLWMDQNESALPVKPKGK